MKLKITPDLPPKTLRRRRDRRSHALGRQMIGLRPIIAGHYVAPDLDRLGLQPEDA